MTSNLTIPASNLEEHHPYLGGLRTSDKINTFTASELFFRKAVILFSFALLFLINKTFKGITELK